MREDLKNPNKIEVKRTIFHEVSYKKPFTFKAIKHLNLQDDDVITAGYEEAYYGSDSSYDAHFYITVTRKELETDKEHAQRLKDAERDSKWAKERRLESFKKLYKEFMGEELLQPIADSELPSENDIQKFIR